jgi:diguanylate cyclase (GGDEF)-like protein
MLISGTFLKSRVSKRIAMLLLIAAVIPAALMTLLSNQKINLLVANYEHESLVEKSRSYALSTFSNLTFARSKLEQSFRTSKNITEAEDLLFSFHANDIKVFNSISEVAKDGVVFSSDRDKHIPIEAIQAVNDSRVMVWSNNDKSSQPSVNLILKRNNSRKAPTLVVAEISPAFLWGEKLDYPSDISVCAYQTINNTKTKLFCSAEYSSENNNLKPSKLNNGSWELFLAGEFGNDPWLFEINRLHPITESHLKELVGSRAYIGIAILSLLIIGLLSLMQIRKTMGPLENLIDGTKRIADGDFSPVKVSGTSEFTELANAFNQMSSRIERQFDTLQSYSAIDREIGTSIDIEQVTNLIMERMQSLEPTHLFCIGYLEEKSEYEGQFHCTIAGYESLNSIRLSMPTKEINTINRYGEGKLKKSTLSSDLVHERLMAELGTNYLWVLPIFWQGELCAFLSVGSKAVFDLSNAKLSEFRELASRIGVVISAHQREQKLLLEAQYDNLTGLPNRILLQDRLQQAMEHADRTGYPLWVVFIDLDRFKNVNDSLGHAAGDALLTALSNRLHQEVRETDTVARFGGDEFVIVLAGNANENTQLSVLNRIMNSIAKPIHISNQELVNTCSVGISVYPHDGKSSEVLIKNADIAMYRAKELGKNNYQFFTQRLNDQAAERMQVISLLRKAIAKNEFALYYQPKVDLATNNIVGLEALLRWNNPELGNITPAKFIPIAEEAGLIITIGDWVLSTACKQMAIWQKSGLEKLIISVNISAKQLHQDDLVEKIKSTLIETGANAECLELELTESLLMTDSSKTINKLHAIKSMGVHLSIDDFGTGYSNLSYLEKLPIDTLKIDKSFIDSIKLNTDKAPIVNTIISLGKNMNLKVIAEGAESSVQVQYLKTQNCDQIQGHYFSKALPANEIKEMIISGKNLELPKLKLVKNAQKKNSS